jgi:alanine dehydrogenase
VYGRNPERGESFAHEMSEHLQIDVQPNPDLVEALHVSDICVTCTPAKKFFVWKDDVAPGTFIAAVGADSPDKQELEPALLADGKLVVDILDQCEHVGELHHAIAAGLMSREGVHAELGELIAGKRPGRT